MQGDFNDDGGRGKEEENPGVVTLRSCSRVSPSVELLAQKWGFWGGRAAQERHRNDSGTYGKLGGGEQNANQCLESDTDPKIREERGHTTRG